jgi:hypothetical protein
MRRGSWNVRSRYRSGSLTAVARELASYKLESADVQVVLGRSAMKVEAVLCFSSQPYYTVIQSRILAIYAFVNLTQCGIIREQATRCCE